MKECDTKEKVKDCLIRLSGAMPVDKITVKTLISFTGISRATFYKYFINLTRVWHEITHDILKEMSLLEEEPFLPTACSNCYRLEQLTDYIYQRREIIKMLLSDSGDPIFQSKWEQQTEKWIAGRMKNKKSYPQEKADNMARFLSCALIRSIIEAVNMNNRDRILDSLNAMEDILYSFSANQSFLASFRQVVSS